MTVPVGTVVGSSVAEAGNDVGAQDELLLEPEPAPPPAATPVAVDEADEADALEVMFGIVMLPDMLDDMLDDAPEADWDDEAVADDCDAAPPESTLDVAEATWPDKLVAKDGMAEAAEKTPVVTGPARELAAGAAYESEAAAAMATTLNKVNFMAAYSRPSLSEGRAGSGKERRFAWAGGEELHPERAHHTRVQVGGDQHASMTLKKHGGLGFFVERG